MEKTKKPPWQKPKPKTGKPKKLTAAQKQAAKTRAAKAGRPYPNLVDNMAIAKKKNAKKKKMISPKRLLQFSVLLGGCVPVSAGLFGGLAGLHFAGGLATLDADSHFRYLSGLLLGIGFGFWSCIPRIEHKTARFQMLTAIVFLGGLMRLYGSCLNGMPEPPMQFGLLMELVVTPLLCWWQGRVARK